MRFLVDESTGPVVAKWLAAQNHDVVSIYDHARGLDDDSILAKAIAEDRILITNDKDFGEKIFRDRKPLPGIVLLRLSDERSANKIILIERLLKDYSNKLSHHFVVVSEHQVRITPAPQ